MKVKPVRERVEVALTELINSGKAFSVAKVCATAGIARSSLTNHSDLLECVRIASQNSKKDETKRTDKQLLDAIECAIVKLQKTGKPFTMTDVMSLARTFRGTLQHPRFAGVLERIRDVSIESFREAEDEYERKIKMKESQLARMKRLESDTSDERFKQYVENRRKKEQINHEDR